MFGLSKLFGGGKGGGGGEDPTVTAEKYGQRLTAATPQEIELLQKLGISADQADQGMLDEIRKLGERGDDLANVDEAYMDRAYQPAFERLMRDYRDMDQGVIENMNARGIAAVPGGASEPEAYQRSLLARDTKETLARTRLEAQNQAVQQKLGQYQARLGETQTAATRYGQTMTPYQNLIAVPETERMAMRVSATGGKLGHQLGMHGVNSQRKMADNQNVMNLIGAGMGVGGSAIGALVPSDPELKKDRQPGPSPEEDLADVSDTPIDRWRYRWEDDDAPMHQGAMADEAPEGTQVPGGIDIASYMGKLTNSIKALNDKVGAFERLMATQGGA